jgi:hypothetical protein
MEGEGETKKSGVDKNPAIWIEKMEVQKTRHQNTHPETHPRNPVRETKSRRTKTKRKQESSEK